MKIYRCGYCGHLTDKHGHPIEIGKSGEVTEEEFTNGFCCAGSGDDKPKQRVTREMAQDAGIPEIEGHEI